MLGRTFRVDKATSALGNTAGGNQNHWLSNIPEITTNPGNLVGTPTCKGQQTSLVSTSSQSGTAAGSPFESNDWEHECAVGSACTVGATAAARAAQQQRETGALARQLAGSLGG